MIKSLFTILYSLVFLSTSLAQDQKDNISVQNPIRAITFDLLSPVYYSYGPSNLTRWRIGYRHQLNRRLVIGADLGYGDEKFALRDEGIDYRLYELVPELQYLLQLKSKTQVYFALQPFYLTHTETLYGRSVYAQKIGSVHFDEAAYQRTKYGLTLNYGFIFPISSRIGINIFMGGGVKRRENNYKSFVNPSLDEFAFSDECYEPKYFENDIPFTEFQFSFGIKAYFLINSRNSL